MTPEEIRTLIVERYPNMTQTPLSAAIRSWSHVAHVLGTDPVEFFFADRFQGAGADTIAWASAWYLLPGDQLVEYYDFVLDSSRSFDVTTVAHMSRVRLDFNAYDPASPPNADSHMRIEGTQDNDIYLETTAAGLNAPNLLRFARLLIQRIR